MLIWGLFVPQVQNMHCGFLQCLSFLSTWAFFLSISSRSSERWDESLLCFLGYCLMLCSKTKHLKKMDMRFFPDWFKRHLFPRAHNETQRHTLSLSLSTSDLSFFPLSPSFINTRTHKLYMYFTKWICKITIIITPKKCLFCLLWTASSVCEQSLRRRSEPTYLITPCSDSQALFWWMMADEIRTREAA